LADLPETVNGCYEFNAAPSLKSLCFDGLMLSHYQHCRILQILYKRVRISKKEGANAQMGNISESTPSSPAVRNTNCEVGDSSVDVGNGILSLQGRRRPQGKEHWKDAAQAREEIEATLSEANIRINEASDSVKTLKARLAARKADHDQLRQEITRATHDGDSLEIENERIVLQLERQVREGATILDREEECRQLRREVGVLRGQKAALVLILEDVYGRAVGDDDSAGESNDHALLQEEGPTEGWTNLLPRPSDVLGSVCRGPAIPS